MSKTKQANTHYVALMSYPNGKNNRSSAMIRTAIISVTASFVLFGNMRSICSVTTRPLI